MKKIFPQKIAVTSPSFSKSLELRERLLSYFPHTQFNSDGERLTGEGLKIFLQGSQGAIIGLESVNLELLQELPELQVVAKYGVGTDNIDFSACHKKGVTVLVKQGTNKFAVAELTLGLMLGLCRRIYQTSAQLKQGVWQKWGGSELRGKTVGIIGLGYVGQELLRLLSPFGVNILVNDLLDLSTLVQEKGLKFCEKEEIYRQADFLTLHVPLTDKTHHLIDYRVFQKMKQTAFLINTSRGEIVHLVHLKRALQEELIAGVALDTFPEEPPTDLELLTHPRVLPTPHIGGNSQEAVKAMGEAAISSLVEYFGGTST